MVFISGLVPLRWILHFVVLNVSIKCDVEIHRSRADKRRLVSAIFLSYVFEKDICEERRWFGSILTKKRPFHAHGHFADNTRCICVYSKSSLQQKITSHRCESRWKLKFKWENSIFKSVLQQTVQLAKQQWTGRRARPQQQRPNKRKQRPPPSTSMMIAFLLLPASPFAWKRYLY